MADFRNVYFSFHYDDVFLASQIRNADFCFDRKKSFGDWADWESIKRQAPEAIKRWIRAQMEGSSVTAVLIGAQTASREWVRFEIEESVRQRKGLLGIYIDQLVGVRQPHLYPRVRGLNPFLLFPAQPANAKDQLAAALIARQKAQRSPASLGLLSQRASNSLGLAVHPRPNSLGLLGSNPSLGFAAPRPRAQTILDIGLIGSAMSKRHAVTLADQVGCYCWKVDNGYENVGRWIAKAARDAGR